MNINSQTILNGTRRKKELESNPATFASDSGVANFEPNRPLDSFSGTRMAGQQGARALAMMNDPAEAMRTDQWMQQFGQSNQGQEFNAAKLQQAQQMADQNAGVGGLM